MSPTPYWLTYTLHVSKSNMQEPHGITYINTSFGSGNDLQWPVKGILVIVENITSWISMMRAGIHHLYIPLCAHHPQSVLLHHLILHPSKCRNLLLKTWLVSLDRSSFLHSFIENLPLYWQQSCCHSFWFSHGQRPELR